MCAYKYGNASMSTSVNVRVYTGECVLLSRVLTIKEVEDEA